MADEPSTQVPALAGKPSLRVVPSERSESRDDRRREPLEDDISVHIFTASAAMVGVCLTVIGLFRLTSKLKSIVSFGDELLAIDCVVFLASCILAYLALRTRRRQRKYRIEQAADIIFLIGLCSMALICALIAYELV